MEHEPAARLPRRLRELREQTWPEGTLTQAKLATAFSGETPVAHATISGWESTTSARKPTTERLEAYARFFATHRSVEGEPHLVPEAELDEEEHEQYLALKDELLGVAEGPAREAEAMRCQRGSTFTFDEGPINVICPEAPPDAQGALAKRGDPNFTKLQQYGDLDALIELYGHLRACNPTLEVFHQLAREVKADDLSTHVILLGGVAWNQATKRYQDAIGQLPIMQRVVDDYLGGDIFEIEGEEERRFPKWETDDSGERTELIEDVALLARLPNPFNTRRTLTLCNGVHSRGVLGAVRCLTDSRVRGGNEDYLAERFPDGRFALLLKVPVVERAMLSPDLQNPAMRLYEWPPLDARG